MHARQTRRPLIPAAGALESHREAPTSEGCRTPVAASAPKKSIESCLSLLRLSWHGDSTCKDGLQVADATICSRYFALFQCLVATCAGLIL